jgi:hypothetical protein
MIRRYGIELLPKGVAPNIEFELVITTPLDPLSRRRGGSTLPNPFE